MKIVQLCYATYLEKCISKKKKKLCASQFQFDCPETVDFYCTMYRLSPAGKTAATDTLNPKLVWPEEGA